MLLAFFVAGALLGLLAVLGTDACGSGARSRALKREAARRSRRERTRRRVPPHGGGRADGIRVLVAARLAAVLRPGLARRARRHQAAADRVARAAALLLQGPQLPAQRAARQGDRGLHRGGQGRSGDGRAAFRAGQPVPPPRRGRARDPHAPEPGRAPRPRAPSSACTRCSSSARITQGRAARPRRGAVRSSCEDDAARRARRCASCSRSTSRRRTGTRRSTSPARWRPRPGSRCAEGDRQLLLRAGGHRDDALAARRGARSSSRRRSRRNRKCVRANMLLGDLERRGRATCEAAIEAWKRIEQQNPRLSRAGRAAAARRATASSGRLEEGLTLLRGYLEQLSVARPARRGVPATLEAKGAEAAYKLVRDELRRNPTLLGLDKLLEAQIVGRAARAAARPRAGARTWCTATPGGWRATAARTAASRRASSTGTARPAAAGKPIRRAAPRSSTYALSDTMKITVIGTGYVGLVTGACLAEVGNDVLCLDMDADEDPQSSNAGGIPIYEPACEAWCSATAPPAGCAFTTDVAASVAHGDAAVHRRRHAARRGRLGRPAARARGGARDRPAHERLPGRRRQVHRAGRHRRQGARGDRRGTRRRAARASRSAWSPTRSS